MRYKAIINEIQDDTGKYIAHVKGCNIATGRKLAKVCADHLNAEELAKENAVVQVKIANLEHIDNVLAGIEERFDGCEI